MAIVIEEYSTVDHPDHYNQHPAEIECIDVIEQLKHLTKNNLGEANERIFIWPTQTA